MVTIIKQNYEENKYLFNKTKETLRKYLSANIPITHVGSTAIPDMYGKNIIDILIGAKDKTQFEEITQILTNASFVPSKKSKDEIYQFFSSKETETASGDIHIHLVITNTERYSEFIILKDYLLNNKEEALKYSNFKQELIKHDIKDRKQYKAIKSEYVTKLIERAKSALGNVL